MSKNKYKVGQELLAVPLITGNVTTLRVISITSTEMGRVYRAVDINTNVEYVTRPNADDESKFWEAGSTHTCRVYKVRIKNK